MVEERARLGQVNGTMAAGVISLTVKGYLQIGSEEGDHSLTKIESDAVRAPLATDEKELYEALFAECGTVTMDSSSPVVLGAAKRAHETSLTAEDEQRYFRMNRLLNIPGIVIMLLTALVSLNVGNGPTATSFLLLILLFVVMGVFGVIMRRPTARGRRIMDEMLGFKDFLEVAERYERYLPSPPEKPPELFEAYLPYALALGVDHEWSARFDKVFAPTHRADGEAYSPVRYHGEWSPTKLSESASSLSSGMNFTLGSSVGALGWSSGGGDSGSSGGGGGGGGWVSAGPTKSVGALDGRGATNAPQRPVMKSFLAASLPLWAVTATQLGCGSTALGPRELPPPRQTVEAQPEPDPAPDTRRTIPEGFGDFALTLVGQPGPTFERNVSSGEVEFQCGGYSFGLCDEGNSSQLCDVRVREGITGRRPPHPEFYQADSNQHRVQCTTDEASCWLEYDGIPVPGRPIPRFRDTFLFRPPGVLVGVVRTPAGQAPTLDVEATTEQLERSCAIKQAIEALNLVDVERLGVFYHALADFGEKQTRNYEHHLCGEGVTDFVREWLTEIVEMGGFDGCRPAQRSECWVYGTESRLVFYFDAVETEGQQLRLRVYAVVDEARRLIDEREQRRMETDIEAFMGRLQRGAPRRVGPMRLRSGSGVHFCRRSDSR